MKIIIVVFISFSFIGTYGQNVSYEKEVKDIESIVEANLKVVSGPKGKKRDWQRFKYHFYENAQLIGVFHVKDSILYRENTVQQFVENAGTTYEDFAFNEKQIGIKVNQFGNIANVFQSYEAIYEKDGKTFKKRGINSYQLIFRDERWWITNLIWEDETNGNIIPKYYLSKN